MTKVLSQSEKRRIAIQNEQSEVKEDKVILTAVENTFLADGTFVAKGQKVEVSKEYAESVKREKDKSFRL